MYKIIGADQKTYGPVDAAQIRQWQAEGRINSATLLQAEGSNDWRPLSSFPEFVTPTVISAPACTRWQDNGMATAGLVFGILANICCCSVLWAVLGIIFSVIALTQCDANPQLGGRSMAVVGLILAVFGLMWHCLLPLAVFGLHPNLLWLRRFGWRW